MARDRRADRLVEFATRFRQLAQILFERAGENVAAVRQLGDMARDGRADRLVEFATRFP